MQLHAWRCYSPPGNAPSILADPGNIWMAWESYIRFQKVPMSVEKDASKMTNQRYQRLNQTLAKQFLPSWRLQLGLEEVNFLLGDIILHMEVGKVLKNCIEFRGCCHYRAWHSNIQHTDLWRVTYMMRCDEVLLLVVHYVNHIIT